ncbi:hypothetical protein ACJJTC_016743 [Scirpophaga incertulas]
MDTEIKKQLIKSADNIKHKIREIKNNEDAANLKFRKAFKPITDNLETIIKSTSKDNPVLNVSIDMSNRDIDADRYSSLNYEDFSKNALTDSNESSTFYDSTEDDNINDTMEKDEVMEIYDNNDINIPFGVRRENKNFMIGNSKVSFSSTSNASQTSKSFSVSIATSNAELTVLSNASTYAGHSSDNYAVLAHSTDKRFLSLPLAQDRETQLAQ